MPKGDRMWFGFVQLVSLTAMTTLVTLAAFADAASETSNKQSAKMGHPYLDELGNICQDKMEMMQHVEYDKQIMCKVRMKEQCQNSKEDVELEGEEEEGLCHTVRVKKCQTDYRPSTTKVKVRVCPDGVDLDDESKRKMQDNSVVIDVRPTPVPKFVRQAKCTNGKRAFCVTKYETMCTNKEVEYEMMEDHPRCRVELIEKCEESKPKLDFLSQMMHDKDKNKPKMECRKFPAMRCRIEKMKVMKKKPETKCERMPRQFCRKEACSGSVDSLPSLQAGNPPTSVNSIMDEKLCYFRIQMVNEIVPKRVCQYTPKRVCHSKSRGGRSSTSRKWPFISDLTSSQSGSNRYMAKDSAERDHRVRMSRKYFTGGDETSPKKKVCKSVPVEECHSLRVNPRPVMKEMKRKVCRQPRPDVSPRDRELVKRLQEWAKISVGSQSSSLEEANIAP